MVASVERIVYVTDKLRNNGLGGGAGSGVKKGTDLFVKKLTVAPAAIGGRRVS
jgi:hypothetical protein